VEGERGVRPWEKRGRGCMESGSREGGEAGERGENYATLHNILQSKKCKEAGDWD